MGTSWSLHVIAAGVDVQTIAEQCFALVIAQMSQWEASSEISQFNRAPVDQWFEISAEFGRVLEAALVVMRKSGGAFHPGMGQLSEHWGWGANADRAKALVPQPISENVLHFDADQRRIKRSASNLLDLSGIAKGFAVDLLAERLLAASVRHFLIEIGGELRGEGLEPDGQPWWVEIAMPPNSNILPYRLALHDLSIATSGNYRRSITIDGAEYSHSFNPRTGWPIVHQTSSVSVIHRSAMWADAWATAFTVMGREAAMALAEEENLPICLIEGGREYISAAWQKMLE